MCSYCQLLLSVSNYYKLINWKNAQKDSSKAFDAFLKKLGKDELGNLILQAEDLKNKLTDFLKQSLSGPPDARR